MVVFHKHLLKAVLLRLWFVLLLFIVAQQAFGQIEVESTLRIPAFGEVEFRDLQMSIYPKDTSAVAVIILDDGHVGMEKGSNRFYLEYHTQIKILKTEGFEFADVSIPYVKRSGLKNIRAAVYNLENGEIISNELDKSDMVFEEVVDKERKLKISFPDVVVGSIIEYSYTRYAESPFEFLPWYFQSSRAPVMLSTFSLGFYRSNELLKPRLYGYRGIEGYQRASDGRFVLALEDLPTFEEESYVRNLRDHYSKVDFEYISSYAKDWPDLIERILIEKDFGNTIKRTNTIKTIYPADKNWQVNEESLKDIHGYVSNHFRWNRRVATTFSDKPKKVWETGEGHSADINLTLLMFLRKAGFQADPVFLSTTSRGKVSTIFPTLSQFNNTVIRVSLGDKDVLVDATSKFRPYNILPEYCLNDQGLVIKKGEPEWVPMNLNKQRLIQSVSMDFTLNEMGEMTGVGSIHTPGYRGAIFRQILASGDKEELDKVFRAGFREVEVEDVTYSGVTDVYSPLSQKFDFTFESFGNDIGQRVFLSPVIVKELENNPFLSPSRNLPVEFSMPINKRYLFSFTLPEGYEIEELPEPVKFALPNRGGSYSYILEKTETGFLLMIRFVINKSVFNQEEYLNLREMFSLIIAKQGEQVVLKRTGTN